MEDSYELFDHTADMGLRVRASSLGGLIEPAVAGFYAASGELKTKPEIPQPFRFEVRANEEAVALRDFLTELLVLFERDHRVLAQMEKVEFDDRHLCVTGGTLPIDTSESVYYREVKAVTYHDLAIRKLSNGYEATLILDI